MKKFSKYWTLVGIVGVLALVTPCMGSWVKTSFSQDLPIDADEGGDRWWITAGWTGSFSADDSRLWGAVTYSHAYAWAYAPWEYPAPSPVSESAAADAAGSGNASWSWSGVPGTSPATTVSCSVSGSGSLEVAGDAYTWYHGSAYGTSVAAMGFIAGQNGPVAACGASASGSASASDVDGNVSVSPTGEGTVETLWEAEDPGTYGGKYNVDVYAYGSYQVAAGAGSFGAYSTLGGAAIAYASASGSNDQQHPCGSSRAETYCTGYSLLQF